VPARPFAGDARDPGDLMCVVREHDGARATVAGQGALVGEAFE
jgi:hypothetical protein